jgi:hypothetical protein
MSLQSNVVTIIDKSNLITRIQYVADSLVISSGQSFLQPASVSSNGNVFTITLFANRLKTGLVAQAFNNACGGQNNEYAPVGGGGTPSQLNFFFKILIELNVGGTIASVPAYLAQGSFGGIIDPTTNNWWIGGSGVNSNGQPQLVCVVSGQFVRLGLSGTNDSFTLTKLT